jgi:hypothetical protein
VITPVAVTPGVSDASQTEVAGGPLAEGAVVVMRATASSAATTAKAGTPGTGNPLLPSRPGGPRGPG